MTRAERRAQTRAALLDAAARVFVDRGFAGASVEAIAAEAGYTRGAFYSNFATKEELFVALLQERGFELARSVARDSAGMTPGELGASAAAIQAGSDVRASIQAHAASLFFAPAGTTNAVPPEAV